MYIYTENNPIIAADLKVKGLYIAYIFIVLNNTLYRTEHPH